MLESSLFYFFEKWQYSTYRMHVNDKVSLKLFMSIEKLQLSQRPLK